MVYDTTNIFDRNVILPQWLDNFIFYEMSAIYCRKNKDLVVLDWSKNDILSYLGTYFPRSFAESYCIFSSYLKEHSEQYKEFETISIFDFGCGTGGELIGFIVAVSKILPHVKNIKLRALDGNANALRILELILEKVSKETGIALRSHLMPIVIDDFYDMDIVTDVITQKYDFVVTFKAICEFVTKQQFEQKNPYEHVINVFLPKLHENGVVCIADITSYSDVSNDWLPKMLDRASCSCDVDVVSRNSGFNEEYHVSHSKKTRDLSKIAWRIYKSNTIVET